jgi:hypothetical protein
MVAVESCDKTGPRTAPSSGVRSTHALRARCGAREDWRVARRRKGLAQRGAGPAREAGIGKSALLADARDRAADMHVLNARGVESESELPFAALHQLLRPALSLVEQLPGPQAAALNGALGLADRAGEDRFLISAACLTLLSELAERRPVLCLVDDVQWLDTPSADALLFAGRRPDAEGIVMLFAARDGDARRFEARELPALELGGLEAGPAAALISRAAGDVAPAVRDFLLAHAGGNALALVELPPALTADQLAGRDSLPQAIPLTRDVERLFLERVIPH